MILLTDCHYFPTITFYKKAINFSHIKIDVYDSFRKMTFRNRCVVAGTNGPINLSVPLVEGREQKRPLKEVRIATGLDWQGQHWKTITSCYNRSPWFEFYRDDLELLYRKKVDFLVDWNLACFDWMLAKSGLDMTADLTDSYQEIYPETVTDWRNAITPKLLQNGPEEPVRYTQVFEQKLGFIPHLSILDLLFCEGKNMVKKLGTGD